MHLEPLNSSAIERLKPLWLSVHRHHQSVAGQLAPFVSDETSWSNRKRQYADIFAGEYFGSIAHAGGEDIGYFLCARRPMAWRATFDIPATLWELVTLAVRPGDRGKGIGHAMLAAMNQRIQESDVRTALIGVIPSNLRAVALYQSMGFRPGWITLTRFQSRPAAPRRTVPLVEIVKASEGEVEALAPLWLSLHHHHQRVSPGLGPWVPDVRSWPVIRELLTRPAREGLLLVAKRFGLAVGFASMEIYGPSDFSFWADTLVTDAQTAEIKFLVVDEIVRGGGIGTALMHAVDEALASRGVRDQFVGAIAPNSGAIRFYEALGYARSWLELLRFQ